MNLDNLDRVIAHIEQNKDQWDQHYYHSPCGTKHCVAGWCQILSGDTQDKRTAVTHARLWLQLSCAESTWLFAAEREWEDILEFQRHVHANGGVCDLARIEEIGRDSEGYDFYGFDRDGYDRYGFNRQGFDRGGFGRRGFDRNGFDRDGYDRQGFNRQGIDRGGYGRDDYDCDGLRLVDGKWTART